MLDAPDLPATTVSEAPDGAGRHRLLTRLFGAATKPAAGAGYLRELARVFDLLVPSVAGLCSLHVLEDSGRLRRIATHCASQQTHALAHELGDFQLSVARGSIALLAFAMRRSQLLAPITPLDLDALFAPGSARRAALGMGLGSAILIPLFGEMEPVGVLLLVSLGQDPLLNESQMPRAERLAARVAMVLDAARMYRAAEQNRDAAETSRRRMAFLTDASTALSASLDYRTTLQTVARQSIPMLGECCTVSLLDTHGVLRRTAVAHADVTLERALTGLGPVVPLEDPSHPNRIAIESGRAVVLGPVSERMLRQFASGEYLAFLQRMALASVLVAPLEARGRTIGTLSFATSDRSRGYDADDVALAVDLAQRAALAIDNACLYDEVLSREQALRGLVKQLMAAQEEERRRVAFEIHDGVAQTAAGLQQLLEAFAHDFPGDSAAAQQRLGLAVRISRQTVAEMRRVLAGLCPTVLDDFGLARGLMAHADDLAADGFQVAIRHTLEDVRFDPQTEIALFRLAQEALNNVRRHAGANRAELWLGQHGGYVILEVRDQGCGFDASSVRRGTQPGERLGLLGMRERVEQLGGTLEIESEPGCGTTVRAVVPASLRAGVLRERRTRPA